MIAAGHKPAMKRHEDLRLRAEKLLETRPPGVQSVSGKEILDLIHELSVYHIELELQNEELRAAQAELVISRDKYYRLFDFAPTGYFTLDRDGIILEANRAAIDLVDRQGRSLRGVPFVNFVSSGHKQLFFSHLSKILETRLKQACDLLLAENSRPQMPLHLESMSIVDEKVGVIQILSAAVNMTEQKKAERELHDKSDALQRARDELEIRVLERTAELQEANAKLQAEILERTRAEEEARLYALRLERSNLELQDFAFAASHDLQEPLRKIRSFGDLLQTQYGGSLEEKAKDFLQRMQRASERMQNLIKSLLLYSRVTTKGQPSILIDLNNAAQEAISNLETSLAKSHGTVEVHDLPWVEADLLQMTQLFQNLIGNAVKFARDGVPPEVRVYSWVSGEKCELHVEDNGIGFDPEYAEQIFAPFERLHGVGRYEGVGMGLAICRKIVERHGGSISAKSTPGKGSTFIVTLPLKQPKPGDG
jgi:signal transduction histidine kinase